MSSISLPRKPLPVADAPALLPTHATVFDGKALAVGSLGPLPGCEAHFEQVDFDGAGGEAFFASSTTALDDDALPGDGPTR